MTRAVDLAGLPKAELHCHLDGTIDPDMLDALGLDSAPLRACLPVRSVEAWQAYCAVVDRIVQPRATWFPRVLEHHIARLRAQRVVYAEVFVSGLLFARDEVAEVVELFDDLRARATVAAGTDLQVELVVCIGRGPLDKIERQLPRIVELRRAGLICGVALAGLESWGPVRPLARCFDTFHDLGLGIEIHAGELAGPESVRDAVEHGRPHRLGHALAAFGDEALLAELADRGIHVELCPSSNLALGAVRSLADHPLQRAHALGLAFSINTDDPGPFACSLTSELSLATELLGLDRAGLARILDTTLRAAFGTRPG
jgi:adenosine deaminase